MPSGCRPFNYKPLWKQLIDLDMTKKAFAKKVDQGEASYFDFKQTEQYLRLSAQQIARCS